MTTVDTLGEERKEGEGRVECQVYNVVEEVRKGEYANKESTGVERTSYRKLEKKVRIIGRIHKKGNKL